MNAQTPSVQFAFESRGPDNGANVTASSDLVAACHRRIARRRGQPRAVVAVSRSMLAIVWHLLPDPDACDQDLGSDHYDRHVNSSAKKRGHIRRLEALGYTVTLTPAA